MSRIRVPRIYTLTFEGELEGCTIRVKSIKFGKVRQILALMDGENKDSDLMDAIAGHLAEAIVSWDLADEYGRELPVSRASLDELEFSEVMEITNQWLDMITGPDKDLGKGSNSGATFPAGSLTMEAL